MSEKRKISWRKVLQAVVTLVVVTACFIAVLSAAEIQHKRKIKAIDISITNDRYGFIDKEEIKKMLLQHSIDAANKNIAKLNVRQIEDTIRSITWVGKAEVYVDNAKCLHVQLTQRVPVARVFDRLGDSYYIDKDLEVLPLSDRYIHYTTVVTNVPVFGSDSLNRDFRAKLVAMVKYIDRDSFWNAQVSQIAVNDSMEFELMPILGNHVIKFGDTIRLEKKFEYLFTFYKNVLNRVGWDKYNVLDVRFDKQIVASPALPWKVPVDKAAANMSWVKSIIGEEPKEATQPVVTTTVSMPNATASQPKIVEQQSKPETQKARNTAADMKVNNKAEQGGATMISDSKVDKPQPKYIYKGD